MGLPGLCIPALADESPLSPMSIWTMKLRRSKSQGVDPIYLEPVTQFGDELLALRQQERSSSAQKPQLLVHAASGETSGRKKLK